MRDKTQDVLCTKTLLTACVSRCDRVEDLDSGSGVGKAAQGAILICIIVALHFLRFSTLKCGNGLIRLAGSKVIELEEKRILLGRACPDVAFIPLDFICFFHVCYVLYILYI